jgi:hypothetical protein
MKGIARLCVLRTGASASRRASSLKSITVWIVEVPRLPETRRWAARGRGKDHNRTITARLRMSFPDSGYLVGGLTDFPLEGAHSR